MNTISFRIVGSQEGRSGSVGHVVNIVMIEGTALAQRDLKTQNAAAVPLGFRLRD